ncbi:hypothetical protein TNCV_1483741 [Trichonephila clavipes]|nr:hypothetical protein TNCV_1483741 [Trichonephila clavipes]
MSSAFDFKPLHTERLREKMEKCAMRNELTLESDVDLERRTNGNIRVIDKKNHISRAEKKSPCTPPRDPLTGLSPTEDVKAAHPKNHITASSCLRDGCSGHRVNVTLSSIQYRSRKMPSYLNGSIIKT